MATRQVHPPPVFLSRRDLLRTGVALTGAALLCPSAARAQSAGSAPADAPIEGLSADEFEALRPLARRGAAVLIRDADQGSRARITVVVRTRAPLATVRGVVSNPEQYTRFMPTLTGVEILSRRGAHTGFRFHVEAILFDVITTSALHVVNDRRVDVAIIQSDIGPGTSRWDLLEDGEGTLVALTTRGDPSQGNWLLRQVAARSPNAIAGMNISADTILALGVARHSDILAGRQAPERPAQREAPPGPLEPPPPGPWMDLTRTVAIGSVTLDGDGVFRQSTMALYSPRSADDLCAHLERVEGYPSIWHSMRDFRIVSRDATRVRYSSVVQSPLAQTRGEEEREVRAGPLGPIVTWRGVSGDHVGYDHRWDLVRVPSGGTVVMLTGGSEFNRTGGITAAMMGRDVWLTPGYATSWKLIWMRPLLAR